MLPWPILLLLCYLLKIEMVAAQPVVKMTSLEWPPYTGATLPLGGIVGQRAKSAFALMGYKLEITYLPWRRAIRHVEQPGHYIGFLPEYASPSRALQFHCSRPIMDTPLALLQNASFPPLHWLKLTELKPYRIGVVSGYLNTPEFDELMLKKELQTEEATSDLLNLRKVAMGRLPFGVVDPWVLDYYLQQDPLLQRQRSNLYLPPHPLGTMQLVACFRLTPDGKRWRDLFNQGLERLARSQDGSGN